jgi:hypothetical protein
MPQKNCSRSSACNSLSGRKGLWRRSWPLQDPRAGRRSASDVTQLLLRSRRFSPRAASRQRLELHDTAPRGSVWLRHRQSHEPHYGNRRIRRDLKRVGIATEVPWTRRCLPCPLSNNLGGYSRESDSVGRRIFLREGPDLQHHEWGLFSLAVHVAKIAKSFQMEVAEQPTSRG